METPAVMGETQFDFYGGPTGRWDHGNRLYLRLYSGSLSSADALNLLAGANLAAVQNGDGEWEVLQFRNASLTGDKTYELSDFLRGQYGTESAMRQPVAAGARFVLLDAAVEETDMSLADLGLPLNWRFGPAPYDPGNPVYTTISHTFRGAGLRPYSPVHLRGVRMDDDLIIRWVRRTRLGGDNWDLPDVPLNEESERYELDIMDGASVKRTLTASAPSVVYTVAQQIADFGAAQPSVTVRVHQVSALAGRSPPRQAVL